MEGQREIMGKIEELEFRVNQLESSSKDPFFTEYLRDLRRRIEIQKTAADRLKDELDAKCAIYRKRLLESEEAEKTDALGSRLSVAESVEVQGGISVPPHSAAWTGQENRIVNSQAAPWQANSQAYRQIQPWKETQKKQDRKNPEFAVGATMLGIVGGVFILVALLLLGIRYMSGFVMGMSQYAVFAALLAVSETVIYRKVKKLGCLLTSIAIGGLYLATYINYLALGVIHMWAALGITAAVSLIALFLAGKRDVVIYKMIGILAGYIGVLILEKDFTRETFPVCIVMILVMNLISVSFGSGKDSQKIANIIHMAANTFFILLLVWRANSLFREDEFYQLCNLALVAVSVLLMNYIFVFKNKPLNTGMKITYGICALFYLVASIELGEVSHKIYEVTEGYTTNLYVDGFAVVILAVNLLTLLWMRLIKAEGRNYVYGFMVLSLLINGVWMESETETAVVIALLFIVSRVLSKKKDTLIRVFDVILAFAVSFVLVFADGAVEQYIALAGIVIGILLISGYKTFIETILTIALAVYAAGSIPVQLKLPAAAGVFFVGMLLVNYIKRYRDEHALVYNIIAITGQVVCCLFLVSPVYRDSYITYFSMLVFGIATFVWLFQKSTGLDFNNKNLALAIFLTYMGLVLKSKYLIINSIVIMVIALFCVGIGFWNKEKSVRIYGLVLALLTCIKIVIYDFPGSLGVQQKIILFFTVGIIALIISMIYIILEKRETEFSARGKAQE